MLKRTIEDTLICLNSDIVPIPKVNAFSMPVWEVA